MVLERRLGWDGSEGCTGMSVLMSTDDDKDVQTKPRIRSSK